MWIVVAIFIGIGWAFFRQLSKQREEIRALQRRVGTLEAWRDLANKIEQQVDHKVATPIEPVPQQPVERPVERPEAPPIVPIERPMEAAPIERPVRVSPPPPAPRNDSLTQLWNRLMGGNPMVRIGIAVLFVGVAILLKYAYDRVHIPIEIRLSAVAAGAIAMLWFGFRQRVQRPDFGLAMQGGGVALLYMTVFGALKVWHLIHPAFAFFVLAGIAVLAGALAVMQSSLTLAVIGTTGGFLAPILASTGAGNHVMLFTYYAILNVGILAIARYRAWRALNVLGFVFTFVIGTVWGVLRYEPAQYWTTQPFLILFAALFTAIALLYANREASRTDRYLDGALVFGVPVIGFALQAALVRSFEYGTAISAFTAGAAYIGLATALYRRAGERLRMLVEAFLAIGVAFATLSIPLALDGRWTAASWALEGAALVWVGTRQKHLLARVAGYTLQILAAFALIIDHDAANGPVPFGDSLFLGMMLLAIAGALSARWLRARAAALTASEHRLHDIFAVWSLAWFVAAIGHEIGEHVADEYALHVMLAFGVVTAAALTMLDRRIDWPLLGRIGGASVVILALGLVARVGVHDGYPSAHFGWLVWPVVIGVHYWILRNGESRLGSATPLVHGATLWIMTILVGWEAAGRVNDAVAGSSVWGLVAWAVVPAIVLGSLPRLTREHRWPFGSQRDGYLLVGGLPIAIFLGVWAFFANFGSSGSAAPIPYVPFLNPLELALGASAIAGLVWLRGLEEAGLSTLRRRRPDVFWGCVAAIGFVVANAILTRTLHHWGGIPFTANAMMHSKIAQSAFSIFWTVLALGATVLATRWSSRVVYSRAVWMTGAGLLAVVVAKLFIVDLSGGVERVVSFIVVGLLMLAIGYLAPLPPKARS